MLNQSQSIMLMFTVCMDFVLCTLWAWHTYLMNRRLRLQLLRQGYWLSEYRMDIKRERELKTMFARKYNGALSKYKHLKNKKA